MSFPCGASGKEHTCQCRRLGFDPWVGKVSWRRKGQPIPVFLPVKSNGQRSLEGYSLWVNKESGTTEQLSTHTSLSKQLGWSRLELNWKACFSLYISQCQCLLYSTSVIPFLVLVNLHGYGILVTMAEVQEDKYLSSLYLGRICKYPTNWNNYGWTQSQEVERETPPKVGRDCGVTYRKGWRTGINNSNYCS